ncbi:MAG: TonB C-terminal domain-containing protein [Methylotenera sp.]
MLRQRENTVSFKAGLLSIGVHAVLVIALLISVNWKTTHPVSIAEVELWDHLPPSSNVIKPLPEPVEPIKPEPVIKEEPKPEPKPVIEPKEEPKIDIALEKKKKELEQKKADEKLKKEQDLLQKKQLAALQEEARKDIQKPSKPNNEALKKLQQEALADEKAAGDQQALGAKAAANAGIVDEYKSKISAKIRGNVNKTLCGDGNPELKFDIGLLPTGQLSGNPKLIKSSGNSACDEAVERAIMASEPLPLPSDGSLFSQFRNLNLKFRPNDGN